MTFIRGSSLFTFASLAFARLHDVTNILPKTNGLNDNHNVKTAVPSKSTMLYNSWSKAELVNDHLTGYSKRSLKSHVVHILADLLKEIEFSLQLQLESKMITTASFDRQMSSFHSLLDKLSCHFTDLNLTTHHPSTSMIDVSLNENVDMSSHPLTGQFRNAHTVIESLISYFNLQISISKEPLDQMQHIIDAFDLCHEILSFLSTIDKSAYLGYVSRVRGSSGGDSRQLKLLSNHALKMDTIFDQYTDDQLKAAILFKKPPFLHHLIVQYLECKKKLGHFWSFHQIMALGNIGNAKGTSDQRKSTIDGLSVLVQRYAFKGSNQQDDRIYNILGASRELFQTFSPGIELEDNHDMSYSFGTHSFGPFTHGTITRDLIPTLYLRRSKIDQKLRDLGSFNSSWAVSFGPGASSWFEKIIQPNSIVTLPKNEFLAAKVAVKNNTIQWLDIDSNQLNSTVYESISSDADTYLFSLVNSIDQTILNEERIRSILNQALKSKKQVTVIFDGAQAFGNVDYSFLGPLLDQFSHIPIVVTGSMIKHLRCGKAGFMFSNSAFRKRYPSIGAWTEHVAGLKSNALVPSNQFFYGDLDTPNAFAYLQFLTTYRGLQKDLIKKYHDHFFKQLNLNSVISKSSLVGIHQFDDLSFSNTLVFIMPSEEYTIDFIEFLKRRGIDGVDYKNDAGDIKLRIGFNYFNTLTSIAYLVDSIHLFEFYYNLISK